MGMRLAAHALVERTPPSPESTTPRGNRLLAALPEEDYQALLPLLAPVSLPLGMALYESGGVQGYVYFPTSSIVSLLYVLEDGSSAEIAVTAAKAWWGSRCSWAARPRRAAPSCRAPAMATGSGPPR